VHIRLFWNMQAKDSILSPRASSLRQMIAGRLLTSFSLVTNGGPETSGSIDDLGILPRRENKVKAIKMIGLAALTALMAMAFVGTTSASATQLCNTDTEPCGSATTSVHEVSVGKAKLLTSIGTTECNALFSSTKVGAAGKPQILEGNFTYTNCELGSSKCTATEENGPSEIKIEASGTEEAKVTGEGLVHLVCGMSIDCSYNGTNLVGTGKGPLISTQANGEVSISEAATTKEAGGFLCPKSTKLDITTSPLVATYLGGGGGGGGGGVTVSGQALENVGVEFTVTITNNSAGTVEIESETWDGVYLEGRGSSCLGLLGPGGSCSNRKFKCVKKGDTKYTVKSSIGSASLNVKCD
jgi:hypothetical protein